MRLTSVFLVFCATLLLSCAAPSLGQIESIKTEPADGETVDRPVRSLRIWFDQEPDVDASSIELSGPGGELQVEGIHTMGDSDLMVRVAGRMPDGEYTAKWTVAGDGGDSSSGEWTFSVERGGGSEEPDTDEDDADEDDANEDAANGDDANGDADGEESSTAVEHEDG